MSNLEGLGTFRASYVRVTLRRRGARPACLVPAIPWAPRVRRTALPAAGGVVPVHLGTCEDLSILFQEGTVSAGQPGARGLCPSAPWHVPFWIILVRYLYLQRTHVLKTKSMSLQYLSRGCCLQAGGKHADRAPLPSTHLAERLGCLAGTLGLNFSVLFLLIVCVLSRFSPNTLWRCGL